MSRTGQDTIVLQSIPDICMVDLALLIQLRNMRTGKVAGCDPMAS